MLTEAEWSSSRLVTDSRNVTSSSKIVGHPVSEVCLGLGKWLLEAEVKNVDYSPRIWPLNSQHELGKTSRKVWEEGGGRMVPYASRQPMETYSALIPNVGEPRNQGDNEAQDWINERTHLYSWVIHIQAVGRSQIHNLLLDVLNQSPRIIIPIILVT